MSVAWLPDLVSDFRRDGQKLPDNDGEDFFISIESVPLRVFHKGLKPFDLTPCGNGIWYPQGNSAVVI